MDARFPRKEIRQVRLLAEALLDYIEWSFVMRDFLSIVFDLFAVIAYAVAAVAVVVIYAKGGSISVTDLGLLLILSTNALMADKRISDR